MNRELCIYSSDELFQCSQEGYFGVLFPELQSNEWNNHQYNTRVSAETVQHKSKYIILFLIRHNDDKNDYKNENFHTLTLCLTHWVYVLLTTSQSIVHDVTITRQLWRDHVDSDISLDIYFIHGGSCKNAKFHGLRINQMALNQNSSHSYDLSDVPHL